MAVRFRKYFKECKPVQCTGRRSRQCPETPKRANGEYKTCGVWCLEFFDDNKQWQSLTFKDVRCKTEAERRLVLFISDRERGKLQLPKKKVITSLAEYSRTYLELFSGDKENTFVSRHRAINVTVRYLGSYPLDRITPFLIEKYRNERKERDIVKESSINCDIAILSHLFNTAMKAGILEKNPCKEVKQFKTAQSRDRILSETEIGLLFDKLEGKTFLMVLMSLFAGLRLNEVLRLEWKDIDFNKGLITFTQSKTGKLLTIPLSNYLADKLVNCKNGITNDRIFEDRPITRTLLNTYSQHFRKVFRSIGINNFSFHCLRHSFASISSDTGADIVTTKELLGHSDITMTMRYSHKQMDVKRNAIERVTTHILGMGKGKVLPLVAQTGTA